jgi:hypothetical protein
MNDLKHYKKFISEMSEEMLDAEITFSPKDIKYDKTGKITSYGIKTVLYLDSEKKHQELKDKALTKALVSYLSDAEIKKNLSTNPHGIIFTTEVYANVDAKKGIQMYVYFGNKKVIINV